MKTEWGSQPDMTTKEDNKEVLSLRKSATAPSHIEILCDGVILETIDKNVFSKLWSKSQLEETSNRLKYNISVLLKKDVPIETIQNFIIDTIEGSIREKMNKLEIDSKRLKALLMYHVRTLRSIKKELKVGAERASQYIDNELYNINNITIEDLYKILDSISEKK